MSRYAKNLLIAGISATVTLVVCLVLILTAPSDTSAMMKIGVFGFLYSFMADIVIWRVYEEFKKTNLLKKDGCYEK